MVYQRRDHPQGLDFILASPSGQSRIFSNSHSILTVLLKVYYAREGGVILASIAYSGG